MKHLVFRNGINGLTYPGPDGERVPYPPTHVRLIAVPDDADELEAVQYFMAADPTLKEYVGIAPSVPADRRFRNQWRAEGPSIHPNPQRNVGNRVTIRERPQ